MKQFDPSIPVLNHHCHVCFPHPIDEALQNYEKMFQRMAISGAGLLSCPGSGHNGGSLDVFSGNVKRAPRIFVKLGLEWFYRLITDPKRIKRMARLPLYLVYAFTSKDKGEKTNA